MFASSPPRRLFRDIREMQLQLQQHLASENDARKKKNKWISRVDRRRRLQQYHKHSSEKFCHWWKTNGVYLCVCVRLAITEAQHLLSTYSRKARCSLQHCVVNMWFINIILMLPPPDFGHSKRCKLLLPQSTDSQCWIDLKHRRWDYGEVAIIETVSQADEQTDIRFSVLHLQFIYYFIFDVLFVQKMNEIYLQTHTLACELWMDLGMYPTAIRKVLAGLLSCHHLETQGMLFS